LGSNPEHSETDHRTNRHDNQSESKIQLIQNNQREKRHRADLKQNTKVMQHCQKFRVKFMKTRENRNWPQALRAGPGNILVVWRTNYRQINRELVFDSFSDLTQSRTEATFRKGITSQSLQTSAA
tara:strand:- start:229401 stop:229775 length:375 start_codon:yes stop_codon:yes gene_type:complete